jgi:hypothetical protein
MAQSNLNKTEDQTAKDSDSVSVETDWSAVAAEISATPTPGNGPLGIRELQNRAASALSAPESIFESVPDAITTGVAKQWSARRQIAFFLGAGALCWMLILAPVLIFR